MKQEQNDQYVDGIKLAPCLLIGHHVLLIGLHVHHVHQVHYVYMYYVLLHSSVQLR